MPVTVQVVMAVRNRAPLTERAIEFAEASAAKAGADLRWVVFDDGSTDETPGVLAQALSPRDVVLHGDGSAFWAGGMRQAMGVAAKWESAYDYVLLLNDDTELFPDGIKDLLSACERHRLSLAVGTVVDPATGGRTYGGLMRASRIRRLSFEPAEQVAYAPVDAMNANAVLISRDAFALLGPLRGPFTHALADVDYALTARRREVNVLLAADVVGECSLNMGTGAWMRALGLRKRWALMNAPKGLPPREWIIFCLRHGALMGPLYAFAPFVRLVLGRR